MPNSREELQASLAFINARLRVLVHGVDEFNSLLASRRHIVALLQRETCSCSCGCSHVLSPHEVDEDGAWCGACYGEVGHSPTRFTQEVK